MLFLKPPILDNNCKSINDTKQRFQNRNHKDIISLCFKLHTNFCHQFGNTMRQSPCGFTPNLAKFADFDARSHDVNKNRLRHLVCLIMFLPAPLLVSFSLDRVKDKHVLIENY